MSDAYTYDDDHEAVWCPPKGSGNWIQITPNVSKAGRKFAAKLNKLRAAKGRMKARALSAEAERDALQERLDAAMHAAVDRIDDPRAEAERDRLRGCLAELIATCEGPETAKKLLRRGEIIAAAKVEAGVKQ